MSPEPDEQADTRPETDREPESILLLRRAQGGDLRAYEDLFARYYPRVHAIARARLGAVLRGHTESVDVAQDAMVQAIGSLENFELRDDAQLIGWFARIVENRIRDARRRAHVRSPEVATILEHVSSTVGDGQLRVEPSASDTQPLARALSSEESERLLGALQTLPEASRELILRRAIQGASWQAIAEQLEFASPDAARMAYGRARVALGKLLADGRPD